jgi:hypothetical protein
VTVDCVVEDTRWSDLKIEELAEKASDAALNRVG